MELQDPFFDNRNEGVFYNTCCSISLTFLMFLHKNWIPLNIFLSSLDRSFVWEEILMKKVIYKVPVKLEHSQPF